MSNYEKYMKYKEKYLKKNSDEMNGGFLKIFNSITPESEISELKKTINNLKEFPDLIKKIENKIKKAIEAYNLYNSAKIQSETADTEVKTTNADEAIKVKAFKTADATLIAAITAEKTADATLKAAIASVTAKKVEMEKAETAKKTAETAKKTAETAKKTAEIAVESAKTLKEKNTLKATKATTTTATTATTALKEINIASIEVKNLVEIARAERDAKNAELKLLKKTSK